MWTLITLMLFGAGPQAGCRAQGGSWDGAVSEQAFVLGWGRGEGQVGLREAAPEQPQYGPSMITCTAEGMIIDDPLNHRLLLLSSTGAFLKALPVEDLITDVLPDGEDFLLLSPARGRVARLSHEGVTRLQWKLPAGLLYPTILIQGPAGVQLATSFQETWSPQSGGFEEGLPLEDGRRFRVRRSVLGGAGIFLLEERPEGVDSFLPSGRLPLAGRAVRFLGANASLLVFVRDRLVGERFVRSTELCGRDLNACASIAAGGPLLYVPVKPASPCPDGAVLVMEPAGEGLKIRRVTPVTGGAR